MGINDQIRNDFTLNIKSKINIKNNLVIKTLFIIGT